MEEISKGVPNLHVLFRRLIVADWLHLNKRLYSVWKKTSSRIWGADLG